jgi:hypothetical protein
MENPWTFGWTQVLTIAGLLMTGGFAIAGLRTFDEWRREILEGKRIDIAFEALSIAYESKIVFDNVRSRFGVSNESEDMPEIEFERPKEREHRSSFYAVFKRLNAEKDYFDRVWKAQPRVMAAFGRQAEDIFLKLHHARAMIEGACEILESLGPDYPDRSKKDEVDSYLQLRADIWVSRDSDGLDKDRVGRMLKEFRSGLEELCRPTVDLRYRKKPAP